MHLLLLSLVPAVQAAAPSHGTLHPAGVEVFLECADVPALLDAYPGAPMARMMADEDALGALHDLLGQDDQDALGAREVLQWGIDVLPLPGGVEARALDLLPGLAAFSLSAQGGAEPGALVLVDFRSEAVAAEVAGFLVGLDASTTTPADAPPALTGRLHVRPGLSGTPLDPVWLHHSERRIAFGIGAITPELWSAVLTGEQASAQAALERDRARLGPTSGATVIDGFHTRSPLDVAADWAESAGLLEDPGAEEAAAFARSAGQLLFGTGPQRWRMQLRGDRFVTEIFEAGATTPMPTLPWLGPEPVDPASLANVHAGCFLVHATTIEPAAFLDDLLATLAEGRPSSAVRAELESALGFPLAQVTDRLGPNVVTFVYPLQGIGLPKTFVSIELRPDPARGAEGVIEDLTLLAEQLGEEFPGFRAKKSKYKKRPYLSVTLPEEVLSLGELGTVRPAIGLLGDRLVMTNSSLNLKREIRRELGEEDPLPTPSYPWSGGAGSAPSIDGASAVLYVDWGALLDGVFSMMRSFGGMLSGLVGDLPFDLSNPPKSAVFTRHWQPTLRTERVVDGGTLTRHEASFAFETWLGLVGLGAHVIEILEGPPAAVSTADAEAEEQAKQNDATRHALRTTRTALAVYKIDRGSFPERLDDLLVPTDNYPDGFAPALAADGWGHALRYELLPDGRYRLWSVGPDGIDQAGEGDDVLP